MSEVSAIYQVGDTSVPLVLTIEKEGVGGVTGKAPTVALRNEATTNSYLDWADNTFKTSAWTTKYASMTEVERGHYQRILNSSLVSAIVPGFKVAAEFHVDDGAGVIGDASDTILFVEEIHDVATEGSVPTAGAVADAVWDELLAGHLTAGTTGKALDDAQDAASATAIADAVWDEARGDHNASGSMGQGMNMLVPVGLRAVTMFFRDSVSLLGIPNVGVTVYNAAGTIIVANNRTTDVNGNAVVDLPDGTYTVVAAKLPTYANFTPTTMVITESGTQTFTGTATALPPPPLDPAKCAVYMDTTPATAGIAVEASLKEDIFTTSDQAVVPKVVTGVTDSTGRVTLELYRAAFLASIGGQNTNYRWRVPSLAIDVEISVPNSASASLRSIIVSQ